LRDKEPDHRGQACSGEKNPKSVGRKQPCQQNLREKPCSCAGKTGQHHNSRIGQQKIEEPHRSTLLQEIDAAWEEPFDGVLESGNRQHLCENVHAWIADNQNGIGVSRQIDQSAGPQV